MSRAVCVDVRVGKDWSKGLSALTDPRVARMAVAHRGMRYQRRTPVEECRWQRASRTTLALSWSDAMAYIVGLTATDGCLITGRRAINFKSKDRDLVETYLALLGRTNTVRKERTRAGNVLFTTQFSDAALYEWFRNVGLTPRKSLTLGGFPVPDPHLLPLVRGLLDGDGSIANFVHAPTRSTFPSYRYERLWVFFHSASRAHVDWLRARLSTVVGTEGYLEIRKEEGRHDMFRLKYGKHAAIALLGQLYADPSAPRLRRKWRIWADYVERHGGSDLHLSSPPT